MGFSIQKIYSNQKNLFKDQSVILVVLFNFVPILGVWFEGWTLYGLLNFYMYETVIVMAFCMLKVILVKDATVYHHWSGLLLYKLFLIPLFCIIFSFYFLGIFLMIYQLYGSGGVGMEMGKLNNEYFFERLDADFNNLYVNLGVICLIFSYGFYFIKDYCVSKIFKKDTIVNILIEFFVRLMAFNFFILVISGFLVTWMNIHLAVFLFAPIKIWFDLWKIKKEYYDKLSIA